MELYNKTIKELIKTRIGEIENSIDLLERCERVNMNDIERKVKEIATDGILKGRLIEEKDELLKRLRELEGGEK